jgi:hypothetical protein
LQEHPRTIVRNHGKIMKALIIALALVTLVAAPSFAQRGDFGPYSSSPASPNYGGGGY